MRNILIVIVLLVLCSCYHMPDQVLQANYKTIDNCQNYLEGKDSPDKPHLILDCKAAKMDIAEALDGKPLNVQTKSQILPGDMLAGPIEVQWKIINVNCNYWNDLRNKIKNDFNK